MAIPQPTNLSNLVADHKQLLAQPITSRRALRELLNSLEHSLKRRSSRPTTRQPAYQRPPALDLVLVLRLDSLLADLQVVERGGEVLVEEVDGEQADVHRVCALADRAADHRMQLA